MDQVLELVLRLAAFTSLTGAVTYLAWNIHKDRLSPAIVWKYLLLVMTLKALFRGLLVVMAADNMLVYGHIKGIAAHRRRFHE